ncbi:Growth_factor receptor cysteine-rich domain superfamily [Hexamita inflata]|uniref:Growth factor receptor cysteine-rich domain superfamily n=1 Tax=Hexamita inflata TaxID=28002 RepID=A0AA86PUE9_9EUKA|nr:Growth factor receptor cysteine-rich domain superfamily [Hexamita inflata]
MSLLISYAFQNMLYCDWMLKSRLWSPSFPCELNSTLNLHLWQNPAQNISSDSSTLDARIITALSFFKTPSLSSRIYNILDMSPYSTLMNAHVFVNASVIIDSFSNQTVFVSPFGSIQGSFDNVTVSGSVNLTVKDFAGLQSVQLSKMFGNIRYGMDRVNYPAEHPDEFNFRNVSSSLRYYVNGAEIRDNQTINGVQFNISNGFDDVTVNVSNSDYQIQNDPNMHHFTYELTDSVTEKTSEITAWFAFPLNQGANNNANALDDLYPLSFQMSLEKFYETKGMMIRRFGASGIELDFPYQNVDFVVYQENTKAVAINKQGQLTVCNGNQVYDLKTRQCITREACFSAAGQFLFQSTCVIQCPSNFVVFNKTCWTHCPKWLNQ